MAMRLAKADALGDQATKAICGGEAARLRTMLGAHPELATAIIVDETGAGRTLAHVATDWPGHFPNVAVTISVLALVGAPLDAGLVDSPIDACETPLHWAASADDVQSAATSGRADHRSLLARMPRRAGVDRSVSAGPGRRTQLARLYGLDAAPSSRGQRQPGADRRTAKTRGAPRRSVESLA